MKQVFDSIIYGASVEGIEKALELKQKGKSVLLLNRYGFPGGACTEALSCWRERKKVDENPFFGKLKEQIGVVNNGILAENHFFVIFHPEAIKRVLWQIIEQNKLDYLAHVSPLAVNIRTHKLSVLGKEGVIEFEAANFYDFSNDGMLQSLLEPNAFKYLNLEINAFFTKNLPFQMHGFHVLKQIETPMGQYFSFSVKQVNVADVEEVFNRELDRLIREAWNKHHIRPLLTPVAPVIKTI